MATSFVKGSRGRFALVALLTLVATTAFALIVQTVYFGPTMVTAIDDVGEAIAAVLASAACVWAARRATGNDRVGWTLMGISAGLWAAGEIVWSIYEVGLGVEVPYPSLADAGFLAAMPFAFAGIRSFWSDARGTAANWRVWLDGLIVLLALLAVAWAFGLREVVAQDEDPLKKAFDLAYPAGDLLVGTVLILAIRRARHHQHGRMVLLLGGVAAYSVADSAFSYLTAQDAYGALGNVLDTGWFVGFLMIGLAAIYPPPRVERLVARRPFDLWQLALPWFTLLAAAAADLYVAIVDSELDLFMTSVTAAIAVLVTVNMVLERREYLAVLVDSETSHATLADILARAPVAISRASADLTVMDVNPQMEAIFGPKRSIVGTNVGRYVPAEALAEMTSRLQAIFKGEADGAEGESPMIRADGSTVWMRWKTAAVRDADGNVDYFITMFEDMGARHEAEEAARQSLATLDRLNRLKSEFLQSVSHEFKTALIGIQGFSEFMRDSDQLELKDVRGFAEDIHRDAERLDRMVSEMIALDQVETERANLQLAPVDVNTVIEREVAAAKATVTAAIVADLQPGLPQIKGDFSKLAQAVRTLLENALKYSPDGGTVTVSTSANAGSVTVSVADQGTAARADFDNRLFGDDDLYAKNPIRKIVGTGLGLGIVRQIVEMHAGRVWVERIEDVGSVFHFTLPAISNAMPAGTAA